MRITDICEQGNWQLDWNPSPPFYHNGTRPTETSIPGRYNFDKVDKNNCMSMFTLFESGYSTTCESLSLKPLHTIGKVSLNASILYKNQEMCNKTNLWKFQLISLFLLREKSKNAFGNFCIHSYGRSFRLARRKLIIGSYFTNYSKTITHQAEIFQGKLSTIVIFIPCNSYVYICENVCFLVLPMLCRGFNTESESWENCEKHSQFLQKTLGAKGWRLAIFFLKCAYFPDKIIIMIDIFTINRTWESEC